MNKTIIFMSVAAIAGAVGDLLLAKGMKEMGDISTMNMRGIMDTVLQAITTPKIIIGTVMLAVFYFLWLAVLSWEDVSVAVPMQTINLVLVAFLSQFFLGEVISPMRWLGTALICSGVVVIAQSSNGI